MTPKRLKFVLEQCYLKRRREGLSARYEDTALFLRISPITLRRWLRGERPIPRAVEILFTIFHFWPEIRGEAVDKLIASQDRTLEDEKQH